MEQDIYVDLLFLINFSMDYLCLYVCASVLSRKKSAPKMLFAASLGGIYSVIALFFHFSSLLSLSTDVAVCFLMCFIAFYSKKQKLSSYLLTSFLYIGISMMTGGCMTVIYNYLNRLHIPIDLFETDDFSTYLFAIIAAIAGVCAIVHGKLSSQKASIPQCILTVELLGNTASATALCDSGNLIRDPISGKAVILIDNSLFFTLIDHELFTNTVSGKIDSPPFTFRMIPINTASGKSIITAINAQSIYIEYVDKRGKSIRIEPEALIAPTSLSESSNGCSAIVPTSILSII